MTDKAPYVLASWDFANTKVAFESSLIGRKAMGLLQLPSSWVPPFLVLTKKFYELWQQVGAGDALSRLPPSEFKLVEEFLISTARSSSRVLVRSNAPHERRGSTAGSYLSLVADTSLGDVIRAIDQVCASGQFAHVYVILQECLEPGLVGHMSNERRVSPRRSLWLMEGLGTREPSRIQARTGEHDVPLMADTEDDVVTALRTVAGRLMRLGEGYFHCEWIWTGERVWIVQADPCSPSTIASIADSYLSTRTPPSPTYEAGSSALRHFRDLPRIRWKKLKRPEKFNELGLPTADIFVLTGKDWISSKAADYASIREDLRRMVTDPTIIRCDIAEEIEIEDIFLPTSSPSTDPDKLIAFMEKTAQGFNERGVKEDNWAFLIAQIVPARASAMIHARPEAQVVQVDALWGFPDGLLYLPHDTYFYSCSDRKIRKKVRHKGLCLLATEESWELVRVNPPFDWSNALSASEVETLAIWALQIANHIGHEVQLMALARIAGHRGPAACIPWHYTDWQVLPHSATRMTLPLSGSLPVVSSRSDLFDLRVKSTDGKLEGLLLHPNVDVLRDGEFLEEVATFAFEAGVLIYFEGSLLGHAYYVMSGAGASVIPIASATPPLQIKQYDKLVRDLIPAIISRAGGIARVRTLSKSEAMVLLAQKLLEEAFEVWQCDQGDLVGELADILEVVDSLREHGGISNDELAKVQEAKQDKRGGFRDLIYLEETAIRPLELAPLEPGTLPLFLEGDFYAFSRGLGKTRSEDRHALEFNTDRQPGELLRITVPLVPPVRRGLKAQRLLARSGDYEAHAFYGRTELTITVRILDRKPPAEQLPLFPGFDLVEGDSQ